MTSNGMARTCVSLIVPTLVSDTNVYSCNTNKLLRKTTLLSGYTSFQDEGEDEDDSFKLLNIRQLSLLPEGI